MDATTTRHERYTQPSPALYVAFELSSRTWKLGMTAVDPEVASGDFALAPWRLWAGQRGRRSFQH